MWKLGVTVVSPLLRIAKWKHIGLDTRIFDYDTFSHVRWHPSRLSDVSSGISCVYLQVMVSGNQMKHTITLINSQESPTVWALLEPTQQSIQERSRGLRHFTAYISHITALRSGHLCLVRFEVESSFLSCWWKSCDMTESYLTAAK